MYKDRGVSLEVVGRMQGVEVVLAGGIPDIDIIILSTNRSSVSEERDREGRQVPLLT